MDGGTKNWNFRPEIKLAFYDRFISKTVKDTTVVTTEFE